MSNAKKLAERLAGWGGGNVVVTRVQPTAYEIRLGFAPKPVIYALSHQEDKEFLNVIGLQDGPTGKVHWAHIESVLYAAGTKEDTGSSESLEELFETLKVRVPAEAPVE